MQKKKFIFTLIIFILIPFTSMQASNPLDTGLQEEGVIQGTDGDINETQYLSQTTVYDDYKEYYIGSTLAQVQTLNNISYKQPTKESTNYTDTSKANVIREKYLTIVKDSAIQILSGEAAIKLDSVSGAGDLSSKASSIIRQIGIGSRILLPRPTNQSDLIKSGTIQGSLADKLAVVELAKSYIGKLSYSQPKRMEADYADCSSFVSRMYAEACGVYIESKSWSPICSWMASNLTHITEAELQPGDLIVDGRRGKGHVVMYADDSHIIHMSNPNTNVVYTEIGKSSDPQKKYHLNSGAQVSYIRIIEATS